jgi:RND superfamily putative drug exporter
MFSRLGQIVSHHWLSIIATWVFALVVVRFVAPNWDDITQDGDFAYLPADKPSVLGEQRLADAFPENQTKSQLVLVVARDDRSLAPADHRVANRIARHYHNRFGAVAYQQAVETKRQATEVANEEVATRLLARSQQLLDDALESLTAAIELDGDDVYEEGDVDYAAAFFNRSLVLAERGELAEAEDDRADAVWLDPSLEDRGDEVAPDGVADIPFTGVLSPYTEIVGEKLRSDDKQAKLIALLLPTEFMAIETIDYTEKVYKEINRFRDEIAEDGPDGLELGVTGSAAVGSDMLLSAEESIRNTELLTVVLVVAILLFVYRSPLLIAVPIISIAVSLLMSTSIVAALTQLRFVPGFEWFDFQVFKTSKIFIVVILFGAGTDYCLFLIARYREELAGGMEPSEAVSHALAKVGDALAASALTTILGLGMMFFADFGKFRNSGPAIGLCLFVTLLICLTLAPAILRGFGRWVFWPFGIGELPERNGEGAPGTSKATRSIWHWLAHVLTKYPGRILVVSLIVMSPLAWLGTRVEITYDLLSELAPSRESVRGTALLKAHFPQGESGPVTVVAFRKNGRFDDEDRVGLNQIAGLTRDFYKSEDVVSVRSWAAPLGERLAKQDSLVGNRAVRLHPRTKEIYLAQTPPWDGHITRFDLILQQDPFSIEAIAALNAIDEALDELAADPDSVWYETEFTYTGTTAAIRDLRDVTTADNVRIKILVVLAVFAVLLVILRQSLLCVYMMASVLFSFYVTIGVTELFFLWAYGDTFHGLDWKVPIFLFVILVAIGEDYNIYLATRVLEEKKKHGPMKGLRRAIAQTGGIITSCGLIMAGTFSSMLSGTLRGIVELGFSLSLGVVLDTFVVRPILLPAFLALYYRFKFGGEGEDPTRASSEEDNE